MSTTTKRVILALPVVLLAWIGLMAAVMRFSDAAPAAVVLFPSSEFMAVLPESAAILDVTDMAITFANKPDLARQLYAAGARLVLPAGLTGCLPLTPAQREALQRRG